MASKIDEWLEELSELLRRQHFYSPSLAQKPTLQTLPQVLELARKREWYPPSTHFTALDTEKLVALQPWDESGTHAGHIFNKKKQARDAAGHELIRDFILERYLARPWDEASLSTLLHPIKANLLERMPDGYWEALANLSASDLNAVAADLSEQPQGARFFVPKMLSLGVMADDGKRKVMYQYLLGLPSEWLSVVKERTHGLPDPASVVATLGPDVWTLLETRITSNYWNLLDTKVAVYGLENKKTSSLTILGEAMEHMSVSDFRKVMAKGPLSREELLALIHERNTRSHLLSAFSTPELAARIPANLWDAGAMSKLLQTQRGGDRHTQLVRAYVTSLINESLEDPLSRRAAWSSLLRPGNTEPVADIIERLTVEDTGVVF